MRFELRAMVGEEPTQFPTTQTELDKVLAFAAANGKSIVDPEALAIRQYGEETVLVTIELKLLENSALEGARSTAEIMELKMRDPGQQSMK